MEMGPYEGLGGNPAVVNQEEGDMSIADMCALLVALFAFGTLILKIVEVSRNK